MSAVVQELRSVPTIPVVLTHWQSARHVLLLESPRRDRRGRYSFFMADPVELFEQSSPKYGVDPFAALRARAAQWATPAIEELPPFQGGFAGLLGYELGGCWERLPSPTRDEQQIPCLLVGLYDWVIAWDHEQQRCWIISQGIPETEPVQRTALAHDRLHQVLTRLQTPLDTLDPSPSVLSPPSVTSNFSPEQYLNAVDQVIEYIRRGDLFQANLSQQLRADWPSTPLELYLRLRFHNPAPFAGYLRHDDWAVLSSSPERFLELRHEEHGPAGPPRLVRTRPIKGTRQRRANPLEELLTHDELRESQKDQAENVMIVDLLRNDLSRVCEPGSLAVPELCTLELFETVSHLVSEVQGRLRTNADFWSLVAAAFPGGSITGAPKIRAMGIIQELEQVARGPYCGSLFYHSVDGTSD
ncbi:MAG: anthranilate synthase component I family protein, partial [Planctomycetaceae bacterium]|nr:anthranilate synthase component I family protein [Planctomycetaceae bacterium]